MPINIGWLGGTYDNASVKVYYDDTGPAGPDQPLINGPRGFCLDITNTSGRDRVFTIVRPDGVSRVITAIQGDPVTAGGLNDRSKTLSQMKSWGYYVRGDVSVIGGGGVAPQVLPASTEALL